MAVFRLNPYRDWLGLEQVPSNYYELLGLPDGEEDQERIKSAVARTLTALEPHRAELRPQSWQTLVAQVEAARDCLLATEKKSQYDQRLRRHQHASRASSQPVSVAGPTSRAPDLHSAVDPMAPIELAEPLGLRVAADARGRHSARGRSRHAWAWGSFTYGLMAVSLLGLTLALLATLEFRVLPARAERARQQAAIPQTSRDLPLPVLEMDEERAERDERVMLTEVTEPDDPQTVPLASEGAVEEPNPAPDVDQIHELLRQAFAAIRLQRWPDADQALDQAAALARGGPAADRVARMGMLKDYVHQYWQAFHDGLDGLQGSELRVEQSRVFVVEVNRTEMIIRARGENKHFPLVELPTPLVMAIADRWFDRHAGTTSVFRGAFMLVNPRFSRAEVSATWQAAEQSGVDMSDFPEILMDLEQLELAP